MTRVAWLLVAATLFLGASCQQQDPDVIVEIRVVQEQPGRDLTQMIVSGWGHADTFYVHDEVLMTDDDIDSACVVPWGEHSAIELLFSEEGRDRFAQVTAEHIDRRLGILVDRRLVSAPVVKDTIAAGKAVITGDFSEEEAERIARGLIRR